MSETPSASALLDEFLDSVFKKNLTLYPAQEEAILHLYDGANVILNTPTGSGKSLVAQSLHFLALKSGRRSYYTCPIKALVNEKFLDLCREFGAVNVGMVTGDATVNAEAPIVCCTAEILANLALRHGAMADVRDVIMDEFHYYSDRERGVAWQVPLLTLPQARFLLMSATLGDTQFFEESLTRLNRRPTQLVQSRDRPVPLDFSYRETPIHQSIEELVNAGRAPIYLVNFTQRECAEEAQNLLSVDFCSKEEKKLIGDFVAGHRFDSPYGRDLQRLIKHGVGIHHAGLLPKYRVLVEKLAQKGYLKVICGTDTLGVGVNVPIRTVLFSKLCKYDGRKTAILTVRDFHQISGRAGRKGYDDRGFVAAQAPEHVIENLRLDEKSAANPGKKIVKRKPPEKGFVPWNRDTFQRLIESSPEPLSSQFSVNHGMLLNVLGRVEEDGCHAMRHLIRDSHENPVAKVQHRKLAFQLFRSLVDRKIVGFQEIPGQVRRKIRLGIDLQEDFSLNHALSLFALDTFALLDPSHPDYAVDLLSVAESILENPDLILRKQVDRLKDAKMAEMKAAGIEYDQRMEELEKIEHPKPLREFIYQHFNAFSEKHPWVGIENIRPKSVAREMYELFYSFADYVREYELQRAEGVLLRYLSEVYKVLEQSVPDALKTEGVEEMIDYFRTLLKTTDSSLVEEWERMRNPGAVASKATNQVPTRAPLLVEPGNKRFLIQIRNSVFLLMRALSRGRVEDIPPQITVLPAFPELKRQVDAYFAAHVSLEIGPAARNPALLRVTPEGTRLWKLEQTLCDADGPLNQALDLELDAVASEREQIPVMKFLGLREF